MLDCFLTYVSTNDRLRGLSCRSQAQSDEIYRRIVFFVIPYLILFVLSSLLLSVSGFSLGDSLFEFASAINTIGLSVGVTSATMPDAALWSEIVAMDDGRLDVFLVIASVWRIERHCSLMLSSGARKQQHA